MLSDFLTEKNKKAGNKQGIQFQIQSKIGASIIVEEVMANYKAGLELINSEKHYNEYAQSGFFILVRDDSEQDTRKEVCEKLAKHFGFVEGK